MKTATNIKKALASLVLLVLFFPILQASFKLIKEAPLGGAITKKDRPTLKASAYFYGNFQEKMDQYANENFGFRNSLVRLNHQIAFDLYQEAKANSVVVGKEGYLYESSYIEAYTGEGFIGEEAVEKRVNKLKVVQDTLQKMGVDILVILAPGKGSFYSEYIPDRYLNNIQERTNYKAFAESFQKNGIRYLDFNQWFLDKKESSPYPLYGQAGIHWSRYGEFLAVDSISRFLGELRGVKMPKYVLDSIVISKENLFRDRDIGSGLNLIFDSPTFPMAYPKYHIEADSCATRLKTMIFADSYYWGLRDLELDKKVFDKGQLWYYGKEVFIHGEKPQPYYRMEWAKEIASHDVILILITEGQLHRFDFGFAENTYQAIFHSDTFKEKMREEPIRRYMNKIKNNAGWLKMLREKAEKEGVNLDTMIRNNAIYMLEKGE